MARRRDFRGRANAYEAPLGWVPGPEDIDLGGLKNFTAADLEKVLEIDIEEWRRELVLQEELFLKLYFHLPKEMIFQRELLVARL